MSNIELNNTIRSLVDEGLVVMTLSNRSSKNYQYHKISITKIVDEDVYYQIARYTDKQVFHENIDSSDLFTVIVNEIENYRQADGKAEAYDFNLRVSKKGKVFFKQRAVDNREIVFTHNRQKQYLLDDYENIPVLRDLGIVSEHGDLVKSQFEKFRQINKFIELIDDLIKQDNLKRLNIVGFGCGRSYLTFVLYHYLSVNLKLDVNIVGLDLKKDVIEECNMLSNKYQYENLSFIHGDIADYKTDEPIDMVISLHACDIATDYALNQALEWNVKYIFSVPCCQHELYQQITSDSFNMFVKHGIVKERLAALMTDTLRANILEYSGYDTQVIEYIDSDQSLKNLMIRARYTGQKQQQSLEENRKVMKEFNVKQQTLMVLRDLI